MKTKPRSRAYLALRRVSRDSGVLLRTALVALSMVTSPMTAHADDYISPDLVKVTTPLYKRRASAFSPLRGTYEYSVSWQGIPAASCSVTVGESNGNYVVDASARTYSGIDLLYRLRYRVTGTLSATDLTPLHLAIDHHENSRHKTINVAFNQESGEISAERLFGPNQSEKKNLAFTPHNMTLDPVTAVFLARGLEWEVGDNKHFDVFNGKSRYYITLSAVKRTTIEYKGEERKVIVITPRVRNLTTTKPIAKLREAFIYVTDDEHRDVLRIVSSVFIGSVTTELESFTPAQQLDIPIRMAAANSDEVAARAQMR